MQTIAQVQVHMDGLDETRLIIIPDILTPESYNNLKNCLKTLNYCKGYTQSGAEVAREQLWFHKDNKYFCDSWVARYPRWDAHPYPEEVVRVQERVQEIVNDGLNLNLHINGLNINSCLVNYYRDGNSFIPPHRDNKISFGERPTIVGLSIGATRTLLLKHNNKDVTYEIKLQDNSMFIMAGGSQLHFMHEIPKEPQCHEERWSLTFREHLV